MTLKRIGMFAASLLLGALFLAEDPQLLEASECEGPGSLLCEEHETCLNLLFAKFCSKEYEYYDDEDGHFN